MTSQTTCDLKYIYTYNKKYVDKEFKYILDNCDDEIYEELKKFNSHFIWI